MIWDDENELTDQDSIEGLDLGDASLGIYEYCAEIKFSVLSAAVSEAGESAMCLLERFLREASDYDPEGDLRLLSFTPSLEADYED